METCIVNVTEKQNIEINLRDKITRIENRYKDKIFITEKAKVSEINLSDECSKICIKGGLGDTTAVDTSKVIITVVAGEDIAAHKVVYFRGDNKVYIADKHDFRVLGSVVGMSIEDASADDNIKILLTGKVFNVNWNLEPLRSYFLGLDGNITHIIPQSNEALVKLGTAEDNNTFIFEPKMAIRR